MELTLAPFDLLVLLGYLAAVVLSGLWLARGQKNLTDYLLGGRDLPWWAILGSIVATETSTATFLSVPGVAFARGGDLQFLQLAFGFLLGRILVVRLFLPAYFRGTLFTAYEVLDKRFGGATKRVASLVFLVTRNLGDGLRLFLTAIVLREVLGWTLPNCVLVVGVATIVYTFFGGMRAVVWNDCFQFVVYMLGGLLAFVVICQRLPGGLEQLIQFGRDEDKFRVFDFQWNLTDAYTFWAGIVGGVFLSLGTHGTDQMMVQRYLAARSQADARRALILSGVAVLIQFTAFLLLGVGLACFYQQFPPSVEFQKSDQVFASFIVHQLPANIGLIGLVLAAVFAAAMSTLSSSLNSSATSAVNDLFMRPGESPESTRRLVPLSRGLTIVFGLIQMGVAIYAGRLDEAVVSNVLAIAGFSAGLLLGLFFLGVLTQRVGQSSALFGLLAGLVVMIQVKIMTPLAWPWFALVGAATTFGYGILDSWIWGARMSPDDGSTRNDTSAAEESS